MEKDKNIYFLHTLKYNQLQNQYFNQAMFDLSFDPELL